MTDKLAEVGLGGHQVDVNHNGVPEDAVTDLFDASKDTYVDVTGQAVFKTLFDRYALYANDVLKQGSSGTNLQTYSNNPLTLSVDPITSLALPVTLNQPTVVASPAVGVAPDVNDPVQQSVTSTYTDASGAETFIKYDNFVIDDAGRLPSWGVFAGTSGSAFRQTLLNWNYEQVITASEFQGRSIDLVVAPKILIQSGLMQ